MNPWVVMAFIMAGIVFGIDLLLRRKKWKDNSKEEKISLLVHMCSMGPYLFLSVLGMFWGLAADSAETAFGRMVYDVTLVMGEIYFLIALAAVILSFILRKTGKIKASIWTNGIALAYIVVVLTVNYLAGSLL